LARIYEAPGWQEYEIVYSDPHKPLESLDREIEIIDAALAELVDAGILPHADYDKEKLLAHRAGVEDNFEIPWTAITHRMQRLIYAINAIAQPGTGGRGKSIYLDMFEAARHALRPGSLLLAHNSVNSADQMGDYLNTVRNPDIFSASVNMFVDGEGLEVSRYTGNEG
jgi:hypothetical protein